ncbi:MAG: sulfurtransferase, partial [Gammaproteobacteria bacterium]|nr:sulfurtransferase [Gammaproteobacteria bacterium]
SVLAAFFLSSSAFAATPLVDVGWIKQHSCDDGVCVLDIRNPLDGASRTDYLKGHIPCAVYTNYLTGGWRTMVKKVPGQLPSTDKIAKLIGDLGIDNKTHVVIYHHGKSALDLGSATRVYWTLKVLGHDNASILNGGYLAYIADKKNKPQKGSNKVKAKTFKANLRSDMMASAADVKMAIDDSGTQLIDLRPRHQFIGINRHPKAKRNGTIPSSKNLPESWMTVNGGGTFRNNSDLAKLYDIAGVDPAGKQINFCNTGHWASLGWFVSSEIMGNSSAKLYDGSMVEWTANKSLPMVRDVSF